MPGALRRQLVRSGRGEADPVAERKDRLAPEINKTKSARLIPGS